MNMQVSAENMVANSKPSHDTIDWNTVIVDGRAFRLYGHGRDRIVECDPSDWSKVIKHTSQYLRHGNHHIATIERCSLCGDRWHADVVPGFGVDTCREPLGIYSRFNTRSDAVEAIAKAFIAAGN